MSPEWSAAIPLTRSGRAREERCKRACWAGNWRVSMSTLRGTCKHLSGGSAAPPILLRSGHQAVVTAPGVEQYATGRQLRLLHRRQLGTLAATTASSRLQP
jgi:hypothetical protein